MEFPEIDRKSWFYQNCKRNRRVGAKCCDVCPFKEGIEDQESGVGRVSSVAATGYAGPGSEEGTGWRLTDEEKPMEEGYKMCSNGKGLLPFFAMYRDGNFYLDMEFTIPKYWQELPKPPEA